MRLISSSRASVSVAVETKTIEAVSAIIRAMRVRMADGPQIAGDPLADIFCLADIENFVTGADHPVDARTGRRMFPEAADDLQRRGGPGCRLPRYRRLSSRTGADVRFVPGLRLRRPASDREPSASFRQQLIALLLQHAA